MADTKHTVAFSVAGKTYRVVTTATTEEIVALSGIVEERLRGLSGGRPPTLEMAVLVAMSLAHDAEQHRERLDRVERDVKRVMLRVLEHVDLALATEEDDAPGGEDE